MLVEMFHIPVVYDVVCFYLFLRYNFPAGPTLAAERAHSALISPLKQPFSVSLSVKIAIRILEDKEHPQRFRKANHIQFSGRSTGTGGQPWAFPTSIRASNRRNGCVPEIPDRALPRPKGSRS